MTPSAGATEYTNCIFVEEEYFPNKGPGGEALVMQTLWRMQSTSSLALIPDPLWPRVVARDSVLSKGQIKLFDLVVMSNKWLTLNWIVRNIIVW